MLGETKAVLTLKFIFPYYWSKTLSVLCSMSHKLLNFLVWLEGIGTVSSVTANPLRWLPPAWIGFLTYSCWSACSWVFKGTLCRSWKFCLSAALFSSVMSLLTSLDSQPHLFNFRVSTGLSSLHHAPRISLKALNSGNSRAHLISFPSLREYCPSFPDVQCLTTFNLLCILLFHTWGHFWYLLLCLGQI